MTSPKSLSPILISLLFLLLKTQSITFNIQNNCPYTVWPAAVPEGGRRLSPGQSWSLVFPAEGPHLVKIWARTNCTFDNSGSGTCLTGDCNGKLICNSTGTPPNTLAEYGLNTFAHRDYYDISVLEGFNVPIQMTPINNGCTRSIRCAGDIMGQCPNELRTSGGCHNPCTVHKTAQYCCHSGPCRPTDLSRFFKSRCRDAFTFPEDDPTSTFTCPVSTSYRVVFCP